MDPVPKAKPKKDILAETLMEIIDRNPGSAALLLLTLVLLPWSVDFVSPPLKSLSVVLGPHIWKDAALKEAVDWMRQPILFLLMNLMILSIWMSSGAIRRASRENVNSCNDVSSSSLSSACTKEQQIEGNHMRSLSNFDKSIEMESFAPLSSDSQQNDGSHSYSPRHGRSVSFPFRASKFFPTSSCSISNSKEDQPLSLHTPCHSTTSSTQKLLHTVANIDRFPGQPDAKIFKLNRSIRTEKINNGWKDVNPLYWHNPSTEKLFEDKGKKLTALLGKETSSFTSGCSSSEKSSKGIDHLKTREEANKTQFINEEPESPFPSDAASTIRTSLEKENDGLDERIKVFYARFREQLRQQRLQEMKESLQQL